MNSALEIVQREAVYLWFYLDLQIREIFWFWVLGIVLGSCVSVFFKNSIHLWAERIAGKVPGLLSIIAASALGIASPLCMYGTIPICAAFARKGVKEDFLAAFMMSSVLLNPQLIAYSAALGKGLLWTRIVSCFLCGIVAGLLVRTFFCKKKTPTGISSISRDSANRTITTPTRISLCVLSKISGVMSGRPVPGFYSESPYLPFFSAMFPAKRLEGFLGKTKALEFCSQPVLAFRFTCVAAERFRFCWNGFQTG